jgi:hypothetical protein
VATTLASIISQARSNFLQEPAEVTNGQWTDAQLLALAGNGVKDLYRALKDTYQDFFFTLDEANVSMPANSFLLTGVPDDVFIVLGIEPRDVSTYSHVKFTFKQYTHPDFRAARALSGRTLQTVGDTCEIYYDVVGAGAPVSAPTIYAAPKLSAALPLTLVYVPTLTLATNNPIPGESDMALQLYIAAYARAKVRDDQSPDPNLLELYKTEKESITIAVSPRDESDIETVEDFFQFDSDN